MGDFNAEPADTIVSNIYVSVKYLICKTWSGKRFLSKIQIILVVLTGRKVFKILRLLRGSSDFHKNVYYGNENVLQWAKTFHYSLQ